MDEDTYPHIRGLKDIRLILKTEKQEKALEPRGPVMKTLPTIPECGDFECVNGPPIVTDKKTGNKFRFETYSLCDKCRSILPDIYMYGQAVIPPDWKKKNRNAQKLKDERKQRKNKSISIYTSIIRSESPANKYPLSPNN